jgi:hypothetical protein
LAVQNAGHDGRPAPDKLLDVRPGSWNGAAGNGRASRLILATSCPCSYGLPFRFPGIRSLLTTSFPGVGPTPTRQHVALRQCPQIRPDPVHRLPPYLHSLGGVDNTLLDPYRLGHSTRSQSSHGRVQRPTATICSR